MSNQGQGQVNVNTGPDNPNRNPNQALLLGGVAVALLVIGLIFFLARPGPGGTTAGTPSPTNAPAGVTTLPGTGTTPDAGQATPAPTEQAAPTEAAATEPATTEAATTEAATTEPAATIPTPESTPAEQPTTAVSPDAGPLDQQVAAALQASPIGTGIIDVRQNGPDILEIDFTIPQSASLPEAGAAAKVQVRAILLALSVLPVDLGRVTLTGFYDLPGQPGATPVKLDYLSAVIKSTDWTTLPDDQLYQVSDVQAIKDEFK